MGLVNILGSFVHKTKYEDLPADTIDGAKERLLDFLGGSFFESKGDIIQPLIKVMQSYGGVKESSVIGRKDKLPCPQAAFINSGMSFDTGDIPHTGVMAIAAALAIAEVESKNRAISGKDLVLAIVLGYEVAMRVEHAMIPSPFVRAFDSTGIVGPLAAAAAAGKILALDEAEMADALAISSSLGIGSMEASRPPRPFVLLQIGRACEAGVISALLAREGVQGGDTMLEKGFIPAFSDRLDIDSIEEGLGKNFGIATTVIKLHGGCHALHPSVDTIALIVDEHKITSDDIERIKVQVCPGTITEHLDMDYPENGEAARFSTPFALASFLVYGDAFQDKFTDTHLSNPKVRELINKTTIERSKELEKQSPNWSNRKRAVIVEILTRDGRTLSRRSDFAKGDQEWPITRAEIEMKFNHLASRTLDSEQRQVVISYISKLESMLEISGFFPLLRS